MKYCFSPREILRAKPKVFPDGSEYISSYILTGVTIQTFSHTFPALNLLEIYIGRVDSPYCSNSWAIRENITQLIEQYGRVKFQYFQLD